MNQYFKKHIKLKVVILIASVLFITGCGINAETTSNSDGNAVSIIAQHACACCCRECLEK